MLSVHTLITTPSVCAWRKPAP